MAAATQVDDSGSSIKSEHGAPTLICICPITYVTLSSVRVFVDVELAEVAATVLVMTIVLAVKRREVVSVREVELEIVFVNVRVALT